MAFNIADRVKETTTTTGTGSISLAGAVTGYVSFSSAIGNGNTCYYTIQTQTETEWEVGLGTVSAGVLSRDTVLASSNSGALVNFSAGTKYVFNTEPAIHLKSLVPYTGATASLNLGAYNLTATQLIKVGGLATEFLKADGSVDSTTYMNRAVYDADADGIVDAAMAMRTIGRNATGSTLYKGTVVYISGSTGNRPNFVKAQANSEATSAGTFGVVYADIANNADGYVVTIGTIDTLDTRTTATNPFTSVTLADGDTVYLDPNTAGYITNVKPSAPNHIVYIGKVTRTSPTQGTIVYRIQNGFELNEIHDVSITSVANNDVLVYESATTLWKNKSIATILGYTPANDSLVMHLAGSETATGYKTFSIGLQTTTGDNYLNYTSGATYIGYNAAPVGGYKLAVNGKQLLEGIFTKNLYTDTSSGVQNFRFGTGYELFGTLHSAGGYSTYLTTSGFASGWNLIIGNSTYQSLDIQFNKVDVNVDLRAKAGMSNITGNGSMSTYFSSPYEGFKPTTSNGWGFGIFNSANSVMAAVKYTGQLLLSNYTSTSSFTGTVAGLLGFDASGNVITTTALSGSGTAGQVTYWTGSSAVGGSSNLFWDNTNSRLGIGTSSPSDYLHINQITSNVNDTNNGLKISTDAYNSTGRHLYLNNLSNTYYFSIGGLNGAVLYMNSNVAQQWQYSGTTVMNLGTYYDGSEYSGVGIIGRTNAVVPLIIIGKSGQTADLLSIKLHSAGSYLLKLKATGNLLLNTTTDAGYRLDINGTGASTGALRVTGGLSLFQGGKMTIAASTTSYASLNIPSGTAPTTPAKGDIYYDSSTDKLKCYNGTSWNDLF